VDAKASPPVCKIADFGKLVYEEKRRERDKSRLQSKAKPMKELTLRVGIDPHDFETKLAKLKEFLSAGHPVRVSAMIKRGDRKHSERNLDELSSRVVEVSPPSTSLARDLQ
jgi:translation initiation factor IF-3